MNFSKLIPFALLILVGQAMASSIRCPSIEEIREKTIFWVYRTGVPKYGYCFVESYPFASNDYMWFVGYSDKFEYTNVINEAQSRLKTLVLTNPSIKVDQLGFFRCKYTPNNANYELEATIKTDIHRKRSDFE